MDNSVRNTKKSRPALAQTLFSVALMAVFSFCILHTNATLSPQENTVAKTQHKTFKVVKYPTPNIAHGKVNDVKGVILHHTAEPTIQHSLRVLTVGKRKVGAHVVIDTDGTRYIMAEAHVVTFHAGPSVLAGRNGCNYFTVGIEFQGNTIEAPLTQEQIDSAIEYLRPIISRYKIPLSNIVTHEMVRNAYKQKYPHRRCSGKVDITQAEYKRFMSQLRAKL